MPGYATHFIPENRIPGGWIHVYSGSSPVGKIRANSLKMPELGSKLYSFGALSDVHVTNSSTVESRFIDAIKFLTDRENVAFTCIAGDLVSQGTAEQFDSYINAVETAKGQCSRTAIIHDTTGNHDVEQGFADKSYLQSYAAGREPYTTRELYYSFTHGNDVFIMFGMTGWPGKSYNTTGTLFSDESLQWLYETLEANRNKRCFIFEHCPYFAVSNSIVTEGDGVVIGWEPPTGGYIGSRSSVFMQLMEHYKNAIWLHGHTHQPFRCQEYYAGINYNNRLGFHSIHIPALAGERIMSSEGYVGDDGNKGMGYVVDVYENHIVLRGRDFVAAKFVPIATYCLDTTLQTIEANTFTDSTGTITT